MRKDFQILPSARRKVFRAKPPPEAGRQSAGKKEGGWGKCPEGVASRLYGVKIFARLFCAEGAVGVGAFPPFRF